LASLPPWIEVAFVVAAFVGAVGLGVAVFIWARNWRRRLAEEPITEDTIETYQQMLDEGFIDSEEFDRIQARLSRSSEACRSEPRPTGIRTGEPPRPTDVRGGLPNNTPPTTQPPSE
jgi:hypothetical protein